MNKKEYDAGYQAAIEAIKKALSGNGQGGSGGGQGPDGNELDPNMTPPPVPGGQGGSGKGSKGKNNQNGANNGDGSRTSASDDNHGVVRPEDCMPVGNLNGVPNTPGGMVSKSVGDKIADSEGYEKGGGNSTSVENDWKDIAKRVAKKMKDCGAEAGKLASTIEGLYKTSTDWKAAFRKIVGRAINQMDKRRAMANKNILASRGEMRRTEKDKYDAMDYMMAWIDSSGSMSDEQLKMCLSELYKLACDMKPLKIVIVQCDTKIHQIKEYNTPDELKKDIVHQKVLGRGGTDLKPCWDLLNNDKRYSKRKPDLIVVFTDGYMTQYRRSLRTMNHLCWCFIDNPSCEIAHPDRDTSCIHLNSRDVR